MRLDAFLDPSMINTSVPAKDWCEAIEKAGNLLVNSGAVEERYVDGMIRTVRELGPYIVVAPGVAMPHARPDDGVMRTSVCLLSLAEPVEFGNQENDPVKIVIGLAATDHDAHIDLIVQLASVLDCPGVIESICEATTPESIHTIITRAMEETSN
ncbi:MAG: PTS sugar transporter subunit IIA [Anaerolineales bacterium]|nr:PTS sugar transporter subunit IIA [Anaerolineales bacterium]